MIKSPLKVIHIKNEPANINPIFLKRFLVKSIFSILKFFLITEMRGFLLLFVFVGIVSAKCGLYLNYQHSEARDQRHERAGAHYYNSQTRSDWAFGWGFGFQSLSTLKSCNDNEMFEQCKRAQKIIDMWVWATNTGNSIIELGCADFIVCAADMTENGEFWCQNMDSYDLCLNAQTIIAIANATSQYSIRCREAVKLSDNVPVLDYREAHPITTTTTTLPPPTTFTPKVTTTVVDVTTTPPPPPQGDSGGSMIKLNLKLILLSILVLCL